MSAQGEWARTLIAALRSACLPLSPGLDKIKLSMIVNN